MFNDLHPVERNNRKKDHDAPVNVSFEFASAKSLNFPHKYLSHLIIEQGCQTHFSSSAKSVKWHINNL